MLSSSRLYNEEDEVCPENTALKKLYDAVDKLDFKAIAGAKAQCMGLFWVDLEKQRLKVMSDKQNSDVKAKSNIAGCRVISMCS